MQGQKYSFSIQEKFGRDVRQMLNTKSSAAVQKICLKKKKSNVFTFKKKAESVFVCERILTAFSPAFSSDFSSV